MTAGFFPPRTSATPYYCVVGNPISHSKSPAIHHAFAAQLGRALTYERIVVAAGSLAAAVTEFRALGGLGMNITVPLKAEAWALADVRSTRAELAGAANTLWFDDASAINVDNTDGVGLVRDLNDNHKLNLNRLTVLLLGAGGAARGVIPSLLEAGLGQLQISNRTQARACALADAFAGYGDVCVVPWGEAAAIRPDVIINATSLSLHGELPPLPSCVLHANCVCYDMMYSNEPTAFVAWAMAQGVARACDGLGMLVEQAAEAFMLWHGVRPLTQPVISALRNQAA